MAADPTQPVESEHDVSDVTVTNIAQQESNQPAPASVERKSNTDEIKENKVQLFDKQRQRAIEMVNADTTKSLTIYRENKYGGEREGKCRFNVAAMRGFFPPSVVQFCEMSCNVVYSPNRPSFGFATRKRIRHPHKGHYIISQKFARQFANWQEKDTDTTNNHTYFFFNDEIEERDLHWEPQTNPQLKAFFEREMNKYPSIDDKIKVLEIYQAKEVIFDEILDTLTDKASDLNLKQLLQTLASLGGVEDAPETLLLRAVKGVYGHSHIRGKYADEVLKLYYRSDCEDDSTNKRYHGIHVPTARRSGIGGGRGSARGRGRSNGGHGHSGM